MAKSRAESLADAGDQARGLDVFFARARRSWDFTKKEQSRGLDGERVRRERTYPENRNEGHRSAVFLFGTKWIQIFLGNNKFRSTVIETH